MLAKHFFDKSSFAVTEVDAVRPNRNAPRDPFAAFGLKRSVLQRVGMESKTGNATFAEDEAARLLSDDLFRVVDVVREAVGNGVYRNQARLLRRQSSLQVDWVDASSTCRINVGHIVSTRLSIPATCANGSIRVSRLVAYERPVANTNLFNLVPHTWVKDRALVGRAAVLLGELPEPHRLLFNAIFWDAGRFERFCRQPSSMIGHHSEPNGNLRHTVEVAEEMREYCRTRSFTNMHLGVLAALLHDAGKADEYTPNAKGGWDMTEQGKLLGHKVTVVAWIAAAVAKWGIQLPQDHYEALLHIFTAVPNAPEWMGLREPALHESFLLSICDRLSGRDDLVRRTLSEKGGFGKSHRHLKSEPFKVRG